MKTEAVASRYQSSVITLIAFLLSVAALRASYTIMMPMLFAAMIVAALWPLKKCLDRRLPNWLSYALTIATLVFVLTAFVGAVYLSIGQVVAVLGQKWDKITEIYNAASSQAERWGIPFGNLVDQGRVLAFVRMLASSLYSFISYAGFIGVLVIFGLPEMTRLRAKMQEELDADSRSEVRTTFAAISDQVRRYLATTFGTSVLTGASSAVWALATGLDLALVWGLLNFLLNFIPIIGNVIGIIPPVLYACIQFGGFGVPLLVFAGFAALQIAISNFVYPMLQGRRLSLSPLAIVISMTFWGWLWGVAGALIAVPLTASAVIVCRHFDRSRWIAKLLAG